MAEKTRDDKLWDTKAGSFPQQSSFEKQLKFLLRYASLAPSSHNTQPWRFSIIGQGINVFADYKRRLKVADPTDKELFISVGCAIANIQIGADHFGFKSKIVFFPKGVGKPLVATISLIRPVKAKIKKKSLLNYMTKRLTNRSMYNSRKTIPSGVISNMKILIGELAIELLVVTKRNTIRRLASITKKGIYTALSDKRFRVELSGWVRHNWTNQGDGMPADTMGMPAAASIVAPALVRSAMIAESTSQMEEKMIMSASAVGILHAKKDSKLDWVKAGIAFERIALLGIKHGVYVAPLSAAIEVEEQKKELKSTLTNLEVPMVFFRMGYPTKKYPHSPRLALEQTVN